MGHPPEWANFCRASGAGAGSDFLRGDLGAAAVFHSEERSLHCGRDDGRYKEIQEMQGIEGDIRGYKGDARDTGDVRE